METVTARAAGRRRGWVYQQSPLVYRIVYAAFTVFFRCWLHSYRVVGADRVPHEGSGFLIANHTSAMDPLILGFAVKHRMLRGPGKVELFKNRVAAWAIRKLGIFPLSRDGIDAAGVRTMVELYRAGTVVVVYPEGGRSESGDLQVIEPGFARLAIKLKARLIPAGIAGGKDLLPIGSVVPRRGVSVAVAFGEPFDLSEFYGKQLTPEILREAAAVIHDRIAAAREVATEELRRGER